MSLILNNNINNLFKIGLWKIESSDNIDLQDLNLNKNQYATYKNINNYKRKIEWLTSRFLIKLVLNSNHLFNLLFTDKNGKLYFIDSTYNISISHSKYYIIVIISKQYQIGIDIEVINYNNKINSVKKFLNKYEFLMLKNINILHFYLYWTVKESIYKCYSNLIKSLKNDITLIKGNLSILGFINAKIENYNFYVKSYYIIFSDCIIALCINNYNYEKHL
ncbi:MAG: 4'-phosphopantetheinyl transferase superfamily protein [Bacteroides sp.]|nr:MAG: 4'-phosphopantetheinyl transferase superfamily protein [Bacteroides sp.]